MKVWPLIPRAQAQEDVERALDHYRQQAGDSVALGFVAALEQAFVHIARHPSTGSPRYAHELDLAGLRCWPLKRYPFLVFYLQQADHIDVWRVLHGARDIPSWLEGGDGDG
jgi:toxin ParE1/3/4